MSKSALCIGINNYPGVGSDLSGCVNDVQDWTAVLGARGFTVRQLLDEQATKPAMVEAIGKLIRDAKDGDTCVLQYSGHGSYVADDDADDEPDGRDEVLCPCDVGEDAFIRDDELYDIFSERAHGVRIVFLSDSCHSGTVSRVAPAVDVPAHTPRSRFLPPAAFLRSERALAAARVARNRPISVRPHLGLLISGCQDAQTSADAWFSNRANGAFTYYALRALKELPGDATYGQWFARLREYLPSSAYQQQPNLYGTPTQKEWKVFD